MTSIRNSIRKNQKKPRLSSVEWYNLKKGDRIKVFGGHGPYMLINGIKHNIGVPSGVYLVHKIANDGIHVYCTNRMNHFFVYMGPKKESLLGFSESHKIKKVS